MWFLHGGIMQKQNIMLWKTNGSHVMDFPFSIFITPLWIPKVAVLHTAPFVVQ